MFKNYIKIAFRHLMRNKVYALISVLGLALGISGSSLITLYIQDELTYDHYHENADRIYRLTTILDFNGEKDIAVTNYAAGPTLKQDYPEVVEFTRFYGGSTEVALSYKDKKFKERNLIVTDSSVFKVFSYEFVNGDPDKALTAPLSLVLTESLANKIFEGEDPVGEQVKVNNSMLNVTAVIKDPPANSEIQPRAFISISTLPQGFHSTFNQDWFRVSFFTYLLFDKPVDTDEFNQKLVDFEEKYVQPWAKANGIEAGHEYSITPLRDVHFDSNHEYDSQKGNMFNIYIFSALALFLLLIAAINFVNLTLAQQAKRAKEVGVRKTLGSSRKALITQFLFESLTITFLAMILGLALSEIFMGTFNSISGKSMSTAAFFSPRVILVEVGILVLIGVIGGSYPAFVLSSFKPVKVLKGGFTSNAGGGLFRKVLIFFQFAFSIFMITGTFLIRDQMNHMREVDLGFDRENLVSVRLPADTAARRRLNTWISELDNDSRIVNTSGTSLPTGRTGDLMFRIEQDGKLVEKTVKCLFVDKNFANVLGLDLRQGRNFSDEYATERNTAFIVNQTAAEQFGWHEDALNKRVQWGLNANGQAVNDGKVVGVVNDFNFMSLHNQLEPLILCYNPNAGQQLSVRFAKGDFTKVLDDMESSWKEIVPGFNFEFSFFDQDLDANYLQEQNMFKIFTYFSSISILLAGLGLFALISFTIASRRKEIGVRKVLGASTLNLSWITVKDFIYLMLIAFVLASPVNYYLMNDWQANFAYKAPFGISSYLLSIVIAFTLSMIAVSYHSWKIARSNPVLALREE